MFQKIPLKPIPLSCKRGRLWPFSPTLRSRVNSTMNSAMNSASLPCGFCTSAILGPAVAHACCPVFVSPSGGGFIPLFPPLLWPSGATRSIFSSSRAHRVSGRHRLQLRPPLTSAAKRSCARQRPSPCGMPVDSAASSLPSSVWDWISPAPMRVSAGVPFIDVVRCSRFGQALGAALRSAGFAVDQRCCRSGLLLGMNRRFAFPS